EYLKNMDLIAIPLIGAVIKKQNVTSLQNLLANSATSTPNER
ncbi:5325_t:CDS:1, partial [Entrophospora sp. SA101]